MKFRNGLEDDPNSVPFSKGTKAGDKVALNLVINGMGTVWIDDVILSKEPLK